jgi:hypothetical protein
MRKITRLTLVELLSSVTVERGAWCLQSQTMYVDISFLKKPIP